MGRPVMTRSIKRRRMRELEQDATEAGLPNISAMEMIGGDAEEAPRPRKKSSRRKQK